MRAFHTHWTKPMFYGDEYKSEDYEIIATILSALNWREYMGDIKLYTDEQGYKEYEKYDMLDLWNLGIDTETLEGIPDSIDANYWAAGKLYATEQEPLGSCSIDRDFIIWDDISKYIENKDLYGAHREPTYDVYDRLYDYTTSGDYYFGEYVDFDVYPINASFMMLNDQELKETYIDEFFRFITTDFEPSDKSDYTTLLVFAEQSLLSMMAEYYEYSMGTIFEQRRPYFENKEITHTWGFKAIMKEDKQMEDWYYYNIMLRLKEDYPTYYAKLISNNPTYKKYHDELQSMTASNFNK